MSEQEWRIAKSSPRCQSCSKPFEPEQPYFSALLQSAEALTRQDFCAACFEQHRPENIYYFWKTALPAADAESNRRARPVLDPEFVLDFLRKLDGDAAPQRVAFRYILALMLARKKLLVADGRKSDAGGATILLFREKGGGPLHEIVEPALSAEEIASVSTELGALLGLSAPPAPQVAAPIPNDAGAQAAPALNANP